MCSCHQPIFMNLNFSSLSHEKRQKRSDSFTAPQDRLQFRLFCRGQAACSRPNRQVVIAGCLGFLSFTQILLASIVSINLAISASLRWLLTDKTEFSNNHGLVEYTSRPSICDFTRCSSTSRLSATYCRFLCRFRATSRLFCGRLVRHCNPIASRRGGFSL